MLEILPYFFILLMGFSVNREQCEVQNIDILRLSFVGLSYILCASFYDINHYANDLKLRKDWIAELCCVCIFLGILGQYKNVFPEVAYISCVCCFYEIIRARLHSIWTFLYFVKCALYIWYVGPFLPFGLGSNCADKSYHIILSLFVVYVVYPTSRYVVRAFFS